MTPLPKYASYLAGAGMGSAELSEKALPSAARES